MTPEREAEIRALMAFEPDNTGPYLDGELRTAFEDLFAEIERLRAAIAVEGLRIAVASDGRTAIYRKPSHD